MRVTAGTRLGHYEVLAPLGSGGMGEVYRVRDLRLDRDVAMKVVPQHLASNPDVLARFETEARAVAALSHPNILAIHDLGTENGITYTITELLEGQTLRERLRAGLLDWREAVRIAALVADGLTAAHSKAIVHRDLKPDNIFLTTDRQVKILDFGLARREIVSDRSGSDSATVAMLETEPGTVLGTVGYMSPEQVRGEKAGPASDIFSLGCTLYEMVAGKGAFVRQTKVETMFAVLKEDPDPLSGITAKIPYELLAIINNCVQKVPADRYRSAQDVSAELRSLLTSTSAVRSALTLPGKRRYPRWMPAALAVLAVCLLAGAGLWWRLRPADDGAESLAVLPFVNAGGNPNTEYLSDGITESLINGLSRLPKLRVMSRSAVFQFKGKQSDPLALGRQLKVRRVLVGRIAQPGDKLSISVELVDVRDGSQVWGEQYNRKLADLIEVQNEISKEISENLRFKLTGEEKKGLAKRYTQNTEAYQEYLRGRYAWNQRRAASLQTALEHFRKAISLDPAFALAYAGMADTFLVMSSFSSVSAGDSYPQARAAAQKALEIDDSLAEAHGTLANVKQSYDLDWNGAEREYQRTFQLNPGYATPHQWYDGCLMALGRPEEALRESRKAQELDPLSPVINVGLGDALYGSRKYDEAIAQYRKTIEMAPNFGLSHYALGGALAAKGRYAEAIAEFQAAAKLVGDVPRMQAGLGHAYAAAGQRAEARKILDSLLARAKAGYIPSLDIALVYTGLGEKDRAFEYLEKAVEERGGRLFWVRADPRFDSLRGDPRFATVLHHMRLGG